MCYDQYMMVTVGILLLMMFPAAAPLGHAEDAALHYLRASYFLQNEQPQAALQELNEAVAADPQSSHLHLMQGRCLQILDRPDEALAAYRTAADLAPQNAEPYREQGIILLGKIAQGEATAATTDDVVTLFSTAAKLDPRDVESRVYLAEIYSSQGDKEKKYQALSEAVAIDDNRPNLLRHAGDAARDAGHQREAIGYYMRTQALLQRFAARGGENLPVNMELGSLSLWSTHAYDIAVKAYDAVIRIAGAEEHLMAARIEAEIGKASALYFMEDYQPALALFKKNETYVLTRFSDSIPSLLLTYAHEAELPHAEELLQSLSGNTKAPPELQVYLRRLHAAVLSAAGRNADAAAIFEKEISREPNEIDHYIQLCQIYLEDKRYGDADATLDRAGEHTSAENDDLLFMRAVVDEREGKFDQALAILSRLIDKNPDNHLALNFAGYTMAEQDNNLDTARSYIERALELDPNQGSYLDSMGWVLYKLGDFAEAEDYLSRAQRTKYRDPVIREHLGFLYRAMNRTKEALQEFQAAIDFNLAKEKPVDEVKRLIIELRTSLDIS